MNICELIDAVGGPDAVRVQFLDQCADDLDWSAKNNVTRISFGVEQALTPNGTEKFGIVVWLDREAVGAALAKARGAAS
jgi:hypothetical protein